MGVARSSCYAEPVGRPADAVILAEIGDITDAIEGYGDRRVDAELRHRGFVVNAKKVRRRMQEKDLNPRRRRLFVRTTDSDHDSPVFPFVAKKFEAHGPDRL
jgi:putative transposase